VPNGIQSAALDTSTRGAPWVLLTLAGGTVCIGALCGVDGLVLAASVTAEVVFFAFFLRHFGFAISAVRGAPADLDAPVIDPGFTPRVSVVVACRNEESVVDQLVTALCALDYPEDRLQLVVVDDGSTDRTGALLDARQAQEPRVRVVHRPRGAPGGKSGALNAALESLDGEIVVVFDADHRPRRDVLRHLIPHFRDPTVGAVQGRCEISNPTDSPLAQVVAVDYLAGYLVNEYGRQSLFQLPAYGGANCAVRASSLRELGGWNPNTVTEDTDLTLRLVLRGERVRYDVRAVDAEEAVVTFRRYWRQRYRWARGHQQVWREFRMAVWRSRRLSLAEKIETTMFLLAFHVPVVSLVGIGVALAWLFGVAEVPTPLGPFVLWTLLFLGPLLELGTGVLVARADRRMAVVLAFFLPVFFVSIAICTKAWIDGVLGRPYSWVKTKRAGDARQLAAVGAS
jgi:cellulose synthase/poly-beta-1,6-N-acetylglucosamine synthase-like glycosyltransferase